MPTYRVGAKGPEVLRIQAQLKSDGFYLGPVDGIFGGGTESAVRQFQKAHRLTVDGQVGHNTWAALFPDVAIPAPAVLRESVQFRCMALTGSFETDCSFPDCFSGLSGDFDGQGLSFGVLQWNLGQGTLQPLLQKLVSMHPDVMESVFGQNYAEFNAMLVAPKSKQLEWARSVQNLKRSVNEPWRGHFKTLGRQQLFQDIQVQFATRLFNSATSLCKDFGLTSTRAAALMFDIKVQNGSISERIKSQITGDFGRINPVLSSEEAEVERLRIIANRRAAAAKASWVEDVRARKLTIANGQGTVHGNFYDLKEQYGLGLEPL
ncbi:MAG TPA: peptidoglycan-binding domain-containing protein [Terriglobales bacterium]|nr:peptidoglycan-binding domain-containing protein [Terriglobales bacterium]